LPPSSRHGLWRWRPSDESGRGTLARVPIGGNTPWGSDVTDAATYLRDASSGLYNFYVVDPSARQILRYLPAADGSRFPGAPTGYLRVATDVSGYRQLYIDGDVYALTQTSVIHHVDGRAESFDLERLPDDGDLRPGHDFQLFYGTGERGEGRLYIWDAKHSRIVVYDKSDGSFEGQFLTRDPAPPFAELRGMYVTEPRNQRPIVVWLLKDRLLSSRLQDAPARPAASPGASPTGSPNGSPGASPAP
jgi:hypothetical protein